MNAWIVTMEEKRRESMNFPSGGGEVKGAGSLGLFRSEVQGLRI